jgi:hypothetical protein
MVAMHRRRTPPANGSNGLKLAPGVFRRACLLLVLLLYGADGCRGGTEPGRAGSQAEAAIREAVHWVEAQPRLGAEYDFVMTCRIRLLFFWTGKDDVGGGYIRIGRAAADPSLEVIRLLFGSDPAKAHGINRWGAGTEVVRRREGGAESSAFFGFMKASKGESVTAMEREISNEQQAGQHLFEGIVSRVDPGRALAATVPFYSQRDFTFQELEAAEKVVMDQLESGAGRKVRELEGASIGCGRRGGFLSTVLDLTGAALAGTRTPVSRCYIFNSREYRVTLQTVRFVAEKAVRVTLSNGERLERTYHALKETRFQIENLATGKKDNFTILLGTEGSLRGVPVQINYQPNWWFQVTLNLKPPRDLSALAPGVAATTLPRPRRG